MSARPFKALWVALAIIVVIEVALFALPVKGKYEREFFEFAYGKPPSLQKVILYEKLEVLAQRPAEIVFVGDSSTFFGVQPKLAMEHLAGQRVVNLGCCGDTGYPGYRYVAEFALRKNPSVELLVFHMTPRIGPFNFPDRTLANSIYENYLSWKSVVNLPSFSWRLFASNALYFGRLDQELLEGDQAPKIMGVQALPTFETTSALQQQIREDIGWAPLDWRRKLDVRRCNQIRGYTPRYAPALIGEIEAFRELAERYDVDLAVFFNPALCTYEPKGRAARVKGEMERYFGQHPRIFVPFEMFETWPVEHFADPRHLNREGSAKRSHEIGRILRGYFDAR